MKLESLSIADLKATIDIINYEISISFNSIMKETLRLKSQKVKEELEMRMNDIEDFFDL